MRIGVLHLSNSGNSWNMSEGVINTLRRMGHEVLTALCIYDSPHLSQRPNSDWSCLDFVLVFEAEYLPIEFWRDLTPPRALWFTETAGRCDVRFEGQYIKRLALSRYAFFPALQDARTYGRVWLPHRVDIEMFRPLGSDKSIDIGYFGQVYERRRALWNAIQAAGIQVTRIDRELCERVESNQRLVQAINRCRMILALPSYSHSFTTRPVETMACGVPLVLPCLPGFARCNESQWKCGPSYYFEGDIESLRYAIESARAQSPRDILCEVLTRHSLEIRIQKIIDTVTR